MSFEPEPQIGPTRLGKFFKQATGLSAASLVGTLLSVPASLVIARRLGPSDFGRAQFVLLIYTYSTLLRSGIFEGAVRAYIHHSAKGEEEEGVYAQNVGLSLETLVSLVPGLFVTVLGFALSDPLRKAGFWLAPVAVLAASGSSFFTELFSARQRFGLISRVILIRSLLHPVVTVFGVFLIGAPAVFIGPIVSDLVVVSIYWVRSSPLQLRVVFDWDAARPLLKRGFPLGAAAIVYWAYRLVGPTSVGIWTSPGIFGLFAFAVAPIVILTRALSGIQTVSIPMFWRNMAADDEKWVAEGERLTLTIAVLGAFLANLGQAGFPPIVEYVAPSFAPSIHLFEILALNVFFLSVTTFPSLVLDSARVNKQAIHLAIWTSALVLNLAANAVVLASGLGPQAVAWNDIWVQAIVLLVVFETARPYLTGARSRGFVYGTLMLIMMIMGVNALVLHVTASGVQSLAELVLTVTIRAGSVLLVWTLVASVYRMFKRFR